MLNLIFITTLLSFSNSSLPSEVTMKHMPEGNQCKLCHAPHFKNLVLRNGDLTSDIPLLCSQCHGTKYRKWLNGIHGKVKTSWKSEKRERLTCIACHDPHAPKFKKYEAKAAPKMRHL